MQLNNLADHQLRVADDAESDAFELQRRATIARDWKHYSRALRLIRRCLDLNVRNSGAASVLSSVLREMGDSRLALEVTEPFMSLANAPLLTTRAAALCDEERYEEAVPLVKRAMALDSRSTFALAVRSRIRSARPDLWS